jgi:hypothetical protein
MLFPFLLKFEGLLAERAAEIGAAWKQCLHVVMIVVKGPKHDSTLVTFSIILNVLILLLKFLQTRLCSFHSEIELIAWVPEFDVFILFCE